MAKILTFLCETTNNQIFDKKNLFFSFFSRNLVETPRTAKRLTVLSS